MLAAGKAASPELAQDILSATITPPEPSATPRDLCGLLDSISEPIFLLDAWGHILFRNPAGASLPGRGEPVPALLSECDGQLWQCARQLLARAVSDGLVHEHAVYSPGSDTQWLVLARELPNSLPEARRFMLLLHASGESERAAHPHQGSELATRSGLLLTGAAHQAKNLLFGLSTTIEALEAVHGHLQDDPLLERLKDGVSRMQIMLKNFFAHSRPRGASVWFRTSSLVREAVRGCESLAVARNVNLCIGASCDATTSCEPQLLIQALENLLDNALRFSPEGSTVTVDTDYPFATTHGVSIRIADCGPGFHPQDAGKLFTPFFTRRTGGTGLGLAVARNIVERHGGSIELGNRELGGAVVTVQLPARRTS
jgi:signal transduction histidine kinase